MTPSMSDLLNLFRIQENQSHKETLKQTGFWGAQAAGCIFVARDTGRVLLCHRSEHVEQPHTWGNWGGAIDQGELPIEAVHREAMEETGHPGPFETYPLYVFRKGTFSYFNYLIVVDDEFTPSLDWESQGFRWCEWGNWPHPLHFGLVALFRDYDSVEVIKQFLP